MGARVLTEVVMTAVKERVERGAMGYGAVYRPVKVDLRDGRERGACNGGRR